MSLTKLNVSLTQSFRLTSDGERNFIVEQRITVDPSKAPGWAAKLAADPTLEIPALRVEWREVGNYGLTAAGLRAAVESTILRQSVEDGARTSAVELGEFARIISGHSERLQAAVAGILNEKAAI